MGTIDPRAVFNNPVEWKDPWAWAALHAFFVGLAGAAAVAAWGMNEQVRGRIRATQDELERIGLTDALTGLSNRRRLMADLDTAYQTRAGAALAIFDLDGFKDYNYRFGHPAGDTLLARLAARLSATVGQAGRAYRLGGDEFCVLAESVRGEEIDELVARWRSAFTESGECFSIAASSGAALIPEDAADASEALRVCDRRMYMLKNARRVTAARQTTDVLLAALSARSSDLGDHVNSVALMAGQVGSELGLTPDALQELSYAAELHDIGKVAIPDSIMNKPGPLDEEEWEFMRRHTLIGERILSASPALVGVASIVRATHERYDGGGYPDHIRGEEIPLAARIIFVCDCYEAMTAVRPYRSSGNPASAIAELRRCAGSQFDPEVVQAFIRTVNESSAARPGELKLAGVTVAA
jgi:two-component system, cell cycle response regulator